MDHTQNVQKKIAFLCNHFQLPLRTKIRVLKGKCLMTRSNKTEEKYGLWWKTNRCMFYRHDKCGKTRCGIPYNILLNALKYIFLQRSFFFPHSSSYHPMATSASLLGTRTKEFAEIQLFFQEMYRILHHNTCSSEEVCALSMKRQRQDRHPPRLFYRTQKLTINWLENHKPGSTLTRNIDVIAESTRCELWASIAGQAGQRGPAPAVWMVGVGEGQLQEPLSVTTTDDHDHFS